MALSFNKAINLYGIYILFIFAIIGFFLLSNMMAPSDEPGAISHVSTADKGSSGSSPSISSDRPAKTKPSGGSSGSSSSSTEDSLNPTIPSNNAKNPVNYTAQSCADSDSDGIPDPGCYSINCTAGNSTGCDDNCNGEIDEESKVQFIFNQWQNWGKQSSINLYGVTPYVYADSIAGSPFASGSFVPVNMTYVTTNKNVPGLAIDSGNGYFDIWLWGKNDGITKKAVNVSLYLDGITIKSISNIQGAPYERNRDGKAKFGNPGQDQVWVQSGNTISFVATVSSATDAFRVYYTKTACTNNDADNDGLPDYLDICPASKTDATITLDNNNHFADVNMNGIFETKKRVENVTCKNVTYKIGKKTYTKLECHKDYSWVIASSDYTLQDTFGCTCADILAKKPGSDRGQLRYGCTKGTLDSWIAEVGYGWGSNGHNSNNNWNH